MYRQKYLQTATDGYLNLKQCTKVTHTKSEINQRLITIYMQ